MLVTDRSAKWQDQGNGIYLVYFNQDVFEVNQTAVRILELCKQPQTLQGIVKAIVAEFCGNESAVTQDVQEILKDFFDIGLVKEV